MKCWWAGDQLVFAHTRTTYEGSRSGSTPTRLAFQAAHLICHNEACCFWSRAGENRPELMEQTRGGTNSGTRSRARAA